MSLKLLRQIDHQNDDFPADVGPVRVVERWEVKAFQLSNWNGVIRCSDLSPRKIVCEFLAAANSY